MQMIDTKIIVMEQHLVEPAGSTAARTYRLRGGCNGGGVAINGSSQSLPGAGTFANIQSNILIYEFEAN